LSVLAKSGAPAREPVRHGNERTVGLSVHAGRLTVPVHDLLKTVDGYIGRR